MSVGGGSSMVTAMQRRHPLTKTLFAIVAGLLALVSLAGPAAADEITVNDPAGDVAYARGDIISARAIHGSSKVDLRVRSSRGGQPVSTWPNRASYIRWRIDSDFMDPGPEYFVDLRLVQQGAGNVFMGQVRYADTNQLVPNCQVAQGAGNPDLLVSAQQNLYRFQFLRGCVGAPNELKARATFVWDAGAAGVGPVYTDYAPNGGPTGPLASG
jgi:hypothetical protein